MTPTANDLDGDGIPNAWETANFHNPNDATDAARDFDNDGLTTLQEYQLSVSSNGLYGNPIGKWKAFTQPVPQNYADQGFQNVWPSCANDRGDIVVQMEGEFYDENNDWHWQSACALIKADGSWTPINIPGKTTGYLYASDINDNGLILIQWFSEDWSQIESYYYFQSGTASIIKIGGNNCCASRMNNYGDWVGSIIDSVTGAWQQAQVISGQNIANPNNLTSWQLLDINDYGESMGTYYDPAANQNLTFIQQGSFFFSTGRPGDFAFLSGAPHSWSWPAAMNNWGEFAAGATRYDSNWSNSQGRAFFFDGHYQEIPVPDSTTNYDYPVDVSDYGQVLHAGYTQDWHYRASLWRDHVSIPITKLWNDPRTLRPSKLTPSGDILLSCYDSNTNQYGITLLTPDDDTDGDGMPDDWEAFYGFNPNLKDANVDSDNDGTNNLGEFLLRTDPIHVPALDPNGNLIDTRPGIDTDGDHIPNIWEWQNGLDYRDASDAAEDFDRDGYTNLQEFRFNTDPRGAPSYRVRELGPFPNTSSVTISPGVLGNGTSSGISGNGVESLYFTALPADGTGTRPAVWTHQRSESQGGFALYPQVGTTAISLVAQSPTGAALGKYGSGPTWFCYWASPNTPAERLSGAVHDVRQLSNVGFSPSGNYLAATRYLQSSNTYQLVLWKMPASGQAFQPIPLAAPAGATVSTSAKLQVNDAGVVTTTGKVGTQNRGIRWTPSSGSSGNTIMTASILAPLAGGSSSEIVGISNAFPYWITGNSTTGNITHAVVWPQSGNAIDLGTLGGPNSSVKLVSDASLLAGVSEVIVSGTVMYQAFIGRERLDPSTNTKSWVIQAQGSPGGAVTLASLNDAGELYGTQLPYAAPSWVGPGLTLWRHGRGFPLNAILPAASGYPLESIVSINSIGTLLVRSSKSGATVSLLLTPDKDTDGDGLPDAFENIYQLNPFSKQAGTVDSDNDGLPDIEEYRNDTNPRQADTDGDGMKDGWEVSWGLLPLDPADALLDPDNDRVTNLRESVIGTNPTGTYRVETQSFTGYINSFANDGSVILVQPSSTIYYNLLSLPDANGIRDNAALIPSLNSQASSPVYHTPAGDRIVRTLLYDPQNVRGFGNQNGSYYLMPDSVGQPQIRITLTSITTVLTASGVLAPGTTLVPTTIVSSQGTRRLFTFSQGTLVLDENGVYVSSLDPSITWQQVNGNGTALAIRNCAIPATPEKPAHDAREILVSQGSSFKAIPLPASWFPTSLNVLVQRLTDDGRTLVSRGVRNSYGATINEFYLLDLGTGNLTMVRQPGFGNEAITALSSRNGRMLGGSRFQVTPDGSSILLASLRVKASPTATPVKLSSIYPILPQASHITPDGRITATVSQSQSSVPTQFIQLVPQNDLDNDGLPDDWETATGITDGLADADGDGLTNGNEFRNGGDPLNRDTDGDGMDDGIELAAGFDISENDENNNGENDGYEDFDGDTYINREEALCGTDARSGESRPDGTSASIVYGGGEVSSAADAPGYPNPFLAMVQNGPPSGSPGGGTRMLLARNLSFHFERVRAAEFNKPGTREFDSGLFDVTPPDEPTQNPTAVPNAQGTSENAVQNFPKYYLISKTKDTGDISEMFQIWYDGVADPPDYIKGPDYLSLDYSRRLVGERTIIDTTLKIDGTYQTAPLAVTGSISDTIGNPPITDSYDFDEHEAPGSVIAYAFACNGSNEKVLSGVRKTDDRHYDSAGRRTTGYPGYDIWDNNRTSARISELSSEYTNSMLIGDLTLVIDAHAFTLPGFASLEANYLWAEDHSIASMQDARYYTAAYVPAPIVVLPNTRVVLNWKTSFQPQKDGPAVTTWHTQDGTLQSPGIYSTPILDLRRPDAPGVIQPQLDGTGISAPEMLAAINPGEETYLKYKETDATGQSHTRQTIQRAEPIRFQVDLSDQKSNPTLTATGSGAVTLWEQKKDGNWASHSLPFKIPAEQAAGASSDPGRYLLQGTTAGPVILAIKVGLATRGATRKVEVLSADLDIDSDNTGAVNSNDEEENIEQDMTKTGKVIIVNPRTYGELPKSTSDLVEVKINMGNLTADHWISLQYSLESMKVWKTSPAQVPTASDLIEPSKRYTLSELGITGGIGSFSIQGTTSVSGVRLIALNAGIAGNVTEMFGDSVTVCLLSPEVVQPKVDRKGVKILDENGNEVLEVVDSIRFCRWRTDAVTDFADSARRVEGDRFHFRIHKMAKALLDLSTASISVTNLTDNAIGQLEDSRTDFDFGEYPVIQGAESQYLISPPFYLVSDAADDRTFNGDATTDNQRNDTTHLGGFNANIALRLTGRIDIDLAFQAMKPMGIVNVKLSYLASPAFPMSDETRRNILSQFKQARDIYRQMGIELRQFGDIETLITTPRLQEIEWDNWIDPNSDEKDDFYNEIMNNYAVMEGGPYIHCIFTRGPVAPTTVPGVKTEGWQLKIPSGLEVLFMPRNEDRAVFAHEIGHALGLDHTNEERLLEKYWLMSPIVDDTQHNSYIDQKRFRFGSGPTIFQSRNIVSP